MMEQHYDKNGTPITQGEWIALIENQSDYKRIAETVLPDGEWVSTIWLGHNYNFSGEGLPIIVETMVFPAPNDFNELDMERYSSMEEAEEGHWRMVEKWVSPDK